MVGAFMPLDLKEAARALNTSREMLLRWARQGAIPAVEKEGEYQFDPKALEAWAKRRRMPIHLDAADSRPPTDPLRLSLLAAMQGGGVYFGIEGDTVQGVLQAAVDRLSLPEDIDKKELYARLMERESLASTGIGHGVAIPHPRHPLENIPEGGIICTCFLKSPLDFNGVDGQPVFVLFIMMSPGTKRHLEMLARLTFCLHDADFLPNLTSCRTAENLLQLVRHVEDKFNNPSR
jgi:nitrogen PTS system EIIA component